MAAKWHAASLDHGALHDYQKEEHPIVRGLAGEVGGKAATDGLRWREEDEGRGTERLWM
jgi:hypothetical protein